MYNFRFDRSQHFHSPVPANPHADCSNQTPASRLQHPSSSITRKKSHCGTAASRGKQPRASLKNTQARARSPCRALLSNSPSPSLMRKHPAMAMVRHTYGSWGGRDGWSSSRCGDRRRWGWKEQQQVRRSKKEGNEWSAMSNGKG